MKAFSFLIVLFYSIPLLSASFDCSLKLNEIEQLICDNEQLSDLDERLSKQYQLNKSSTKDAVSLRDSQRSWLRNERNLCSDIDCLSKVYQSRITFLKKELTFTNSVEKNKPGPAFEITKGAGKSLCKEYLDILNKTPVSKIKACGLPDLSGSSFVPVNFKPLLGEALKKIDEIVYTQNGGGPWDDWEEKWPQRKKEYDIGFRQLGEAYWDLDRDGILDMIVEEFAPGPRCTIFGKGRASELREENSKLWKGLNQNKKMALAETYGYQKYYSLIKNNELSFVAADNFVTYQGEYLSIDHSQMVLRNTTNDWATHNWIYIWGINPIRTEKSMRYGKVPALCRFSLNK